MEGRETKEYCLQGYERTTCGGVIRGVGSVGVGNVYAAPFCALLLKDLGAEVIKQLNRSWG